MSSNNQSLTTFETRVRQMILRFQELKKENENLLALVEKNGQDIQDLQAKLTQADHDYNSLKMAKMMEITDGDLEGAKARLTKLIRDVNKCIAILSDEEQ
jgi:predicted RNase H-like nuclease (RuvC/YqgF family)